ncbi:carbohydrate ABC transporter permease [Allostreptomyces psammosilenae]|uniref:Arabinogalactan oligomer/maltooligosaccharide transport system permease protein n=1 Tax=Allostreptomyces psammosilenae TaxID=1892865 RepID=A0A852ZUF9_9ACTN|nr:sugar ABC transporter permease [Allostreptomyces psammosilenae]NYI05197.1 arabinogalactan oligomer/maltooligosaccharide transport system permease protein [Allostreptomyces psammosilenae]
MAEHSLKPATPAPHRGAGPAATAVRSGAKGAGPVPDAARPTNGQRLARSIRRHRYAWAMVAPVVIVMVGIIGYPLVNGLWLSLTNANERNVAKTIGVNEIPATYELIGFENFSDVLTSGVFWDKLLWTLVWTIGCVGAHYLIGLALAVLLNRRIRGRGIYRVLLIMPWAVPPFVSAFAWRFLYNGDGGLFNAVLTSVGLPALDWLSEPGLARLSVMLVNIWIGIPFMMVAMLGALQSIPGELYEAAEMDGTSPWQRFRHVTLPGVRTVSMTVLLLGTVWTFNQFPIIFLVSGGGPGDSTEILVTYAYRLAFEGIRNYSVASTWGALILLILTVYAVIYRRVLRNNGEDVW